MEEIKQLNHEEAEQILKLPNSWREREKREIAAEMIKNGLSTDLIVKTTELTDDEVEELRKRINTL